MARLNRLQENDARHTALQMKNALDEFNMFEAELHIRITAIAIERLGYSAETTRKMIIFVKSLYGQ
jgi:hypothetical protein